MIHDANVGTVRIDSMALWRLYGGTQDTVRQDGERATRIAMFEATQPKPEIHFYFRKTTDAYTDQGAFNPFGGNDDLKVLVGVYHDAGPDIDGKLTGCKTLRMSGFGTPSDPASKPRPLVWKEVGGEISIPGCAFGFDPNVVGEVIIQEFKGTSARYGFSYKPPDGNFLWCDASEGVTYQERPARFSIKNVNSRTGYFSGNNANAEAAKNQSSVPYYIGKILGDALQVFAMLPNLPTADGWIVNPYYAARQELKSEQSVATFPVDQLILNTGDELEYARAVVWKQSAMYISPPNIEKVHKAVFTPGNSLDIDPVSEYSRYVRRVSEVLMRFNTRFDVGIGSMMRSLEGDVFNSEYSKLSGQPFVTTDIQKSEARKFMQACIDSTVRVKQYISEKVTALVGDIPITDLPTATEANVASIRTLYTQLNDVLPHWSPSGPIADATGKNRYMVGSVRQKYPVAETEEYTFAIRFKEAFEAIKGGREYTKYVPTWLAAPTAGRRRRRTLRKYKKRGGAEPYGDSAAVRIYNAFTGMINSGLATLYKRALDVDDPDVVVAPRADMLKNEFAEESNVDASLAVRKAEFAKFVSRNPPTDFVTGVQNSGYTTFTDFVEFVCGFEPNTLPPQSMDSLQIEYAISIIKGCQTSKFLRDQALLAELTDYIGIPRTSPPVPNMREPEPHVGYNRAAVSWRTRRYVYPDEPRTKLLALKTQAPAAVAPRRLSGIFSIDDFRDMSGLPSHTNIVLNSIRGRGRRTFRRRLPKLV